MAAADRTRACNLDRSGLTVIGDYVVCWRLCRLDAVKAICYKNCPRPQHSLLLCEGAYSAVAQWQSIRLLTEGL